MFNNDTQSELVTVCETNNVKRAIFYTKWYNCTDANSGKQRVDHIKNEAIWKLFLTQYLLFVSLLNHFWLLHCSPTPDLSIIFRPWSSYMRAITPDTAKAGSSYSHMRGPCIGSWFSDRSNCSQWSFEAAVLPIHPNICTDQWEASVLNIYIYICITLLAVIQLCSPRCWHLDSNYCRTRCRQSQLSCYCFCVLGGTFQSYFPLFTLTWPANHSPNQGLESTHRLHIYPLDGVFYSP